MLGVWIIGSAYFICKLIETGRYYGMEMNVEKQK
jgi:hypothetical protein